MDLVFYNYCLHGLPLKEKTFLKVYLNLITEWSKTLFTPLAFLKKIIKDLSHIVKYGVIIYKRDDILKLLDKNTYKYYKQFYNVLKDAPKFKIVVAYLDTTNEKEFKLCFKEIYSLRNIKFFLDYFSKIGKTPAANFNTKQMSDGCVIILNSNIIDKSDYSNLESHLDHLLNHYFSKLGDDKSGDDISEKSITKKLKKIACDAGYNLKDTKSYNDFVLHMLSKKLFITMLSDTCNAIHLYFKSENKYYDFMKMIKSSFILSDKYKKLDEHLRNAIIFCFFIKVLDKKKWNTVKSTIKKELDNPKKSILKDVKNKFSEVYLRFKMKGS